MNICTPKPMSKLAQHVQNAIDNNIYGEWTAPIYWAVPIVADIISSRPINEWLYDKDILRYISAAIIHASTFERTWTKKQVIDKFFHLLMIDPELVYAAWGIRS